MYSSQFFFYGSFHLRVYDFAFLLYRYATSEFIFFLSAGTTHGAYTRTSGSEASARAFFAPAPSAASGAPRFITHAEEGARQATGGTCDAGDGSEAGDGATQIPLLRFRARG